MTYEEAQEEILTLLKAAWDTTTYDMTYEAVREQRGTDQDPWAFCLIRHASGRQDTLGGAGSRQFERQGNLIVTINTPSTSGLSEAYQLAKIVSDAYEGIASPLGVWFRNIRINELGRNGTFNQTNVVVEFLYYETK